MLRGIFWILLLHLMPAASNTATAGRSSTGGSAGLCRGFLSVWAIFPRLRNCLAWTAVERARGILIFQGDWDIERTYIDARLGCWGRKKIQAWKSDDDRSCYLYRSLCLWVHILGWNVLSMSVTLYRSQSTEQRLRSTEGDRWCSWNGW